MIKRALILMTVLALALTACGQQTTAEKQGIKVTARDGAEITRFDVQKGEDGITTVSLDRN